MLQKCFLFFLVCVFFCLRGNAQAAGPVAGAERLEVWLPYFKTKTIAVFANQTSMVGNRHLVDTLLSRGIKIKKIFGPEHGFRGTADAGEELKNGIDTRSGLPVISLYGDHKKPTPADLADVDAVVFDIQDVGVRFYTYISSLEYLMEACLENHKPLLILDRPNPNGFYIDGPVLEKKFKSFIGMQEVPVVYGMTIGEYALMLAGENLLSPEANRINTYNVTTRPSADTPFHLQVIKCKNYDHNTRYELPVKPSPNLPEIQSIYWYPSTCWFEGTVLSEGRGTAKPFQIFGHPKLPKTMYAFTPKPNEGAKSSKLYFQKCYGWNLAAAPDEVFRNVNGRIQLRYLIEAYKLFPGKDSFFLKNDFFNKLAGNDKLMTQIKKAVPETAIRASWQPGIAKFKTVRKKYLLYKDFE